MNYKGIVAFSLILQALTFAGTITPWDFNGLAKIEDFEGLANVSFLSAIVPLNPHYLVDTGYYFNDDFTITFPASNPPDPGNTYYAGAVVIGDFSQGTDYWGLGHRRIDSPADVYSGNAYLGVLSDGLYPATVTFGFRDPVYKVGAWIDSGQYHNTPLTFEILDNVGNIIDSMSTFSSDWTFVGLESNTPIYSISFTGFVSVVDNLMYEIPEPATMLLFAFGGLMLRKRKTTR